MSEEPSAQESLKLELTPQRIEVQPGGASVDSVLMVRNQSRVVDQCSIDLVGLDAEWFTQPTHSVALFPDDSERLTIGFHVPNQAGLKAGDYPFRVIVRSRSSGAEYAVEGVVAVLGEAVYQVELAPRRFMTNATARFRVQLSNTGAADGQVVLDAIDPEEGLRFQFVQERAPRVPAGAAIEVPLAVTPKHRPLVGRDRTYNFTVRAQDPDKQGDVRSVNGQLVYHPRFASLVPLARAAALAIVVLVGLGAALAAAPAQVRCPVVGNNPSVPIFGRSCGAGEAAVAGAAALPTAAVAAAPVPTPLQAGGGAAGAAAAATSASGGAGATGGAGYGGGGGGGGGGGAITETPTPAASLEPTGFAGGGTGSQAGDMTAGPAPTMAPPTATVVAQVMAGLDATAAVAQTAVRATATTLPPATSTPTLGATATPTTVVRALVAAQPGTCSPVIQPSNAPTPTRAPAKPNAAPSATPIRAVDDWSQSDATPWSYCFGVTADQLTQALTANRARLVDLEVEQAQPTLLLSAVLVRNAGPYAADWSWYFGLEDIQVQERLTANNARPISINAYDAGGGQLRFAVVMVSNKTNPKKWWWFPDLSSSQQIDQIAASNQARVVDVDPYVAGGTPLYAVILVANTGSDQAKWSWSDGMGVDQITAELGASGDRLIDIQPSAVKPGAFAVVRQACPCPRTWWGAGTDQAGLANSITQTGGRITSLATYQVNGQRLFAVTLVANP